MNKPDWKDAPEWANYLAMDRNGTWVWHEKPVTPSQGVWSSKENGKTELAFLIPSMWFETLEERPHA